MSPKKEKKADELEIGTAVKLVGSELEGEISGVHEGGHLVDVTLEDGTVTTVPAAGVEVPPGN